MARVTAFVMVVVLFGSNFPVMRILNRTIPPFYGAALRFLIAAVALLAIVGVARIPLPKGKALLGAFWWGSIGYACTFGCLFFAIGMMGAAPVAVLFATAPLFTALFAALFGVEQLTLRKLLGTSAAAAGSAWIYHGAIHLEIKPVAFALVIAAACAAGLSTVLLKKSPRSHPIGTNAVACAVGGVLLLAMAAATGTIRNDRWSTEAAVALGWLALVGTVAGFSLVTWLILHWSPTKVNYQSVLSPLVAAVLAYLLLKEPIHRDLMVGATAILAGGWAVLLEKKG
jgi:drug/metabolite transporter (DMT)-like permease